MNIALASIEETVWLAVLLVVLPESMLMAELCTAPCTGCTGPGYQYELLARETHGGSAREFTERWLEKDPDGEVSLCVRGREFDTPSNL